MPASVRITSLHTQSQRQKHVFGILQFVGEFLEFQQGFHPREQFFRKDRLVKEIVSADFDAVNFVFPVGKPCDENNRNQASLRRWISIPGRVHSPIFRA